MDQRWARPWFAATAGAVVAGVMVQLFVSADSSGAFGATPVAKAANIFAYFTVLSNVLVGVTTALLALNPQRWSKLFAVARLTGVVAITVTFLVFHVVLSRLLDLDSWAQVANQLLHTIVPVLAIVGWCSFGPRGMTSAPIARLTAIFPLVYMAFTLIRGPLASDFYPYPFADAKKLGYVAVTANGLWIGLLFVALAAGATRLDRVLASRPPMVEAL